MSKISMDAKIEEELIKKCRHDKEAFGTLYNHYKDPIFSFVVSKVESEETAEDITSTVFQKAFEAIESFKWQGISFSSWLYKIARNTVIDHYRSKNKERGKKSLEDLDIISDKNTPEEEFIETDFEQQIKSILETLDQKERGIIYMKFFEGYTNKTIAKLTGLSETNVGTIIYRTLIKLRGKILK